LKETGANLSARLALSMINQEKPGCLLRDFRRRVNAGASGLMLDYQSRIPVANFQHQRRRKRSDLFAYDTTTYNAEIWMAFFRTGGLPTRHRQLFGRKQFS